MRTAQLNDGSWGYVVFDTHVSKPVTGEAYSNEQTAVRRAAALSHAYERTR